MTYRNRGLSPSQDFSPVSSAMDNSKHKHHRHNTEHNNYEDDDDDDDVYTEEASQSQSPYQPNKGEEEEDQQPINNNANPNSNSHTPSQSINNSLYDQFSSPSSPPQKFPHITNTFDAISPSFNSPNVSQFPFYMNIAPLPIFHGLPHECSSTHLTRFTKVCRANNANSIDMMMRIFPVTLENEAALWYDLNIEPYYCSLSWEEIKSSFTEAFRRTDIADQFRSELIEMKQGENELVRSYFLRFQLMMKKWPDQGLNDGILKGIFIDGLRENFRDWMVIQRPNSLDEALRLAFQWEQVERIRIATKKLKCGFCDGEHEEKGCEVRERMREIWVKMGKEMKRIESDVEIEKELVRSVGKKDEEDGKEEGEMMKMKKKKSECQCWKHQCWKKSLERNLSFVTGNSFNAV